MNKKIRRFGKVIFQYVPGGSRIVDYLKWRLFCVYKTRLITKREGVFYKQNLETGLIDIIERTSDDMGNPYEFPGMIVTNQIIGDKWITADVQSVVNIGSGIATFESLHARTHPNVQFLASEMDHSSTAWAKANRKYPNVNYCTDGMSDILASNNGKKFDLAITVDVIEHVADYKSFLDDFSQLADRAVISTPNRDMDVALANGPLYKAHVQEFNAGELYFILKMYYSKVELFSAPDPMKVHLIPVGIYSSYEKLYAYCEK